MSAGALALDSSSGRTGPAASSHPWTTGEIVAGLLTAAVAIAIVVAFHDRFWWAPDEGAFAYVADRLLHGDVLNRDVQDVHGGYIHFVNALALDLFGRDFVSLRYPLALLTVVQSCLVYWLLRPTLGAAAAVAGIAMAALTFVQFINPTPNWYALFLTVLVIALLVRRAPRSTANLAALGFLIGLIFLFRQLSGVLVAIGTFAYLLAETRSHRAGRPVVARFTAMAMAVGLFVYLMLKTDLFSLILYGICPLAILVAIALRTQMDDASAAKSIVALAAGAAVAALPLLAYHLATGSLAGWWQDAAVSAVSLTGIDFFRAASDAKLIVLAMNGLVSLDPRSMANGLFWLIVLFAPLVLGLAVTRTVWRRDGPINALPFVAVFYGLVAVHFAIPIYALYPIGLVLAGLLVMAPTVVARRGAMMATLFAIVIGLVYQAGEPLTRGLAGIIRGDRVALSAEGPRGASVRIDAADQATYLQLLAFIDEHAGASDRILSLPMSPELYFLSGRNAAVRFPIAPLGLRTDSDVDTIWSELENTMPSVVIFRPDDKYATASVRRLMALIELSYQKCAKIGPYELFARVCRT